MARPERAPQRLGVQLERFEAQPELQLVRQPVESAELSLRRSSSPQLSSFLPRPLWLFGGVLLCKLSLPASEHFADFVASQREGGVLFVVERFAFPKHEKQKFYGIEFAYRDPKIW